jgi:hypothetical protein
VQDTATGAVVAPTGTVTFTSGPTTGAFGSSGSCSLTAAGATPPNNSCQVTFTPNAGMPMFAPTGGTPVGGLDYTITASYTPDSNSFAASSTATTLTAADLTGVGVSCASSTVSVGDLTVCTATLSDPTAARPPAGYVVFSATPTTGSFAGSGCIQWQASGTGVGGSATCRTTFSPSAAGPYTVTACYTASLSSTPTCLSQGAFALSATSSLAGGGPGSKPGSGTVTIPVTPPAATASLAVGSRAQVSRRHVATLVLGCTGGFGSSCAGTLKLTAKGKLKPKGHGRKRRRSRSGTIKMGAITFNLAAGSVGSFRVRLSGAAYSLFAAARHGRLKVTASTGGGHITVMFVRASTKHAKKRRKKH